MPNQFYIWKDPNCNGVKPDWIELSGAEFFVFIRDPGNSRRKFIKEYVDDEQPQLGYYKFEVNEEEFRKWKASQKRKERSEDVMDANSKKAKLLLKDDIDESHYVNVPTVVSFDIPISEEDDLTLHDVVADESNDFEKVTNKLLLEQIHVISRQFPEKERALIDRLYFLNKANKSDNEIARCMSIPTSTFNRRKEKILKILSKKVG